jgi:transposase
MARPSRLTDEMQDKLVALLEAGQFASVACRLAGVAESTYYLWMEKGATAKSGRYLEFSEAIKKADAMAEARRVETIRVAGTDPKSWPASAWWLERRHPDRYGRRAVEVSGPKGGPIPLQATVFDVSKMTDEQIDAFIAKADRARAK